LVVVAFELPRALDLAQGCVQAQSTPSQGRSGAKARLETGISGVQFQEPGQGTASFVPGTTARVDRELQPERPCIPAGTRQALVSEFESSARIIASPVAEIAFGASAGSGYTKDGTPRTRISRSEADLLLPPEVPALLLDWWSRE
jgi:hypothetical protein